MTDQEILTALKTLLKPMQNKLDSLDIKLSQQQVQLDNMDIKISQQQVQSDTLRLDIKTLERDIRKDINRLHDGMDTLIAVLENKGILPKVE